MRMPAQNSSGMRKNADEHRFFSFISAQSAPVSLQQKKRRFLLVLVVMVAVLSYNAQQAQAQVDLAREALALAQTQLSYAQLTAPFSGVVLSKAAEPEAYQRANYYQTLHSWGPVR